MKLYLFLLLSIAVKLSAFSIKEQKLTKTPNVVIIFADDLGYGDLGCYGATKLKTPHIDKLASEGMLFTDAHSASAVCTPSRYALLTGQYPFRVNGGKGFWRPLPLNNKLIIDTEQLNIGSLMKHQGYATACIGKWHLGFGNETPTDWNKSLQSGPQQLGFDYYFGVPFVNSGPPYVYVENDKVVGLEVNDPLIFEGEPISFTQQFSDKSPNRFSGGLKAHELYKDDEIGMTLADKSVNWIKKNKDQPFFLYLATTNIHHPFSPNSKFKGTSECGRYGDFVHELDWIVGQITKVLEELNIAGNTLVLFTSDNGGMLNVGGQEARQAGHRQNGNLLGFKFDAWEGGHRVPFIARWPGKIEANSMSDQLVSNLDVLATLAAVTKYDLKEQEAPDSYNILPALVDNPEQMIRDHLVLAPRHPENLALRMDNWIYISGKGGGGFGARKLGSHTLGGPAALLFANEKNSDIENGAFIPNAPNEQLYNLKDDLSQSTNLVNTKPEVAKMMRTTLRLIKKTESTRMNNLNESK